MSDPDVQEYDVAVVGAGVAGLSAATAAAARGLRVVIFEQLGPGGQLLEASTIQDEAEGEQSAADLAAAAMERAMDAGAVLEFAAVTGIVPGDRYRIEADSGSFSAPAVVLAMGSTPLRVDIPGEQEYAGRGVSYCVACDGPLFAGKPVVMLAAGRYASQEARELRELVSEITVVTLDQGEGMPAFDSGGNVQLLSGARPVAIEGDAGVVSSVQLVDGDREWQLDTSGVFVCIGRAPATDLVSSLVQLDAGGRIVVDDSLNAGMPGLYAVGDIRSRSPELLSSAAADGAAAAEAIASARDL